MLKTLKILFSYILASSGGLYLLYEAYRTGFLGTGVYSVESLFALYALWVIVPIFGYMALQIRWGDFWKRVTVSIQIEYNKSPLPIFIFLVLGLLCAIIFLLVGVPLLFFSDIIRFFFQSVSLGSIFFVLGSALSAVWLDVRMSAGKESEGKTQGLTNTVMDAIIFMSAPLTMAFLMQLLVGIGLISEQDMLSEFSDSFLPWILCGVSVSLFVKGIIHVVFWNRK